jgi:hypothetical protein
VAGFHTVTECAAGHDPCPAPGGFDSGQLEQGAHSAHVHRRRSLNIAASSIPRRCRGRSWSSGAATPRRQRLEAGLRRAAIGAHRCPCRDWRCAADGGRRSAGCCVRWCCIPGLSASLALTTGRTRSLNTLRLK